MELCGDFASGEEAATFPYSLLAKNKLKIDKMANGVSFIVTGKLCELTAFEGKNLDGLSTIVPADTSLDLNTVLNSEGAKNDGQSVKTLAESVTFPLQPERLLYSGHITWNDLPLSFTVRKTTAPSS